MPLMFRTRIARAIGSLRELMFRYQNGLGDADAIPTHMTWSEKRALYETVQRFDPKVIVEIGSYLGASTNFLAAACSSNSTPRSTVYCVDTWMNDAMTEGPCDTYQSFLDNTDKYKNIVPIRGSSEIAAKNFRETVDLVFFDGDHSPEAIQADWKNWRPHLQQNAIVAMHDIGWANGVKQCYHENIEDKSNLVLRLPNLVVVQMTGDQMTGDEKTNPKLDA